MRIAFIFLVGFLIIGCSPTDEPQTGTTSPVAASTSTPQQTPLNGDDPQCQDVRDILGFADIKFDATTVLVFYERPDSSLKPAQTLRFYDDKTINSYSFRAEGERSYAALRPDAHKLDYDIFDLSVVGRRNGWLEVIVGERKNETLWLQEDKIVRFKDWLQDMKEAFAVGRIRSAVNPLRAKPEATAKEITFDGRDCFEVVDMKGDWIQVRTQKHYCSEKPARSVSGWLRWRDEKGCLLVEIFPFA